MDVQKQKRTKRFFAVTGLIVAAMVLGAWVGNICRATVSPRLIVHDYLRDHAVRKLQIGAGDKSMPGWLNTDIEPAAGQAYLDASKPFPLPDRSLSYIFSEHVIEHLSYEDGLKMLKESYRTLKPGGKIRTATPNLLKFVRLFQDEKTDEMRRYLHGKLEWHNWPRTATPECLILNLELRTGGHQFVYDVATLRDSLTRAGFQAITEFAPGASDDPELRGIESRHDSGIAALNDYETMILQAVRP